MSQKNYIGVLGLGSRSTLYYLEQLNRNYNQLNGGYSTCPVKLLNADFDEINPYLPSQFSILKPVVKHYLEMLNEMGVERIVVPNITLHETIDRLELGHELKEKLIHPVKEVITELQNRKSSKVCIFGSYYTMTSEYLASKLDPILYEVYSPEEKDKKTIDNCRKKLYEGELNSEDLSALKKIIEKYTQDGVVVLACTELSLVYGKIKNKFVIDMIDVHVRNTLTYQMS